MSDILYFSNVYLASELEKVEVVHVIFFFFFPLTIMLLWLVMNVMLSPCKNRPFWPVT